MLNYENDTCLGGSKCGLSHLLLVLLHYTMINVTIYDVIVKIYIYLIFE